jgi:hypothetical protein
MRQGAWTEQEMARLSALVIVGTFICSGADARQLLCPPKNEEILQLSTKQGDWKPVYEGYLKEVFLTYMNLTQGGRMSMIECAREKGVMVVKEGTCRFIYGAGTFKRRDLLVGVNEACELNSDLEKDRAYPGRDTNDQQCIIECE